MEDIKFNDNTMRRIVRAIYKAISEDVPQYMSENRKETNNAIIHFRGDCINENLRKMVVGENIELIPFKRCMWEGRIIVSRDEKITYTITTNRTLYAIKKKQRNKPHYLQTILHIENRDYEAAMKQIIIPGFEEEDIESDYDSIFSCSIDPNDGYRHYVISYDAEGRELLDIQLKFLDKDMDTISEKSLNEYIGVDFASITNDYDGCNDDDNSQARSYDNSNMTNEQAMTKPNEQATTKHNERLPKLRDVNDAGKK